jgi:hypothetical protein
MWKVGRKTGIRIHEASEKRFKDKVRQITKRNRGVSPATVCEELAKFLTGWLGYYRLASLKKKTESWDAWIRRKIRAYFWKKWKLPKARYRCLKSLGISKEIAWKWANTRKGYWRIAGSQVLHLALPDATLEKFGVVSMSKIYAQHNR